MTDHGTLLVDDVSVFVDGSANQLLGVTFRDHTDTVAIFVLNKSILDDKQAFKTGEGSFLVSLLCRESLGATNDMALVVPELAFSIAGNSLLGQLLSIALDKFTKDVAIGINELASLVDSKAFQD